MNLIVAVSQNGVIGKDNELPFNVPEDLKYFQKVTKGSVVVMGRKTADSIPKQFFPLKDRINIVITSNPIKDDNVVYTSIDNVDEILSNYTDKEIFIIGGKSVYEHFYKRCNKFYITLVYTNVEGDNVVTLPFNVKDDLSVDVMTSVTGIKYKFMIKSEIRF